MIFHRRIENVPDFQFRNLVTLIYVYFLCVGFYAYSEQCSIVI